MSTPAYIEQPHVLHDLILEAAGDIRNSGDELVALARDWAIKENAYRLAKSNSHLRMIGVKATVDDKRAQVDQDTEKERIDCHTAEAVKDAMRERHRGLIQILSAYQSMLATQRSEMQMAGQYEPVHVEPSRPPYHPDDHEAPF